jgi:rRNA maturation endonuclease Nob1
MNDGNVTLDNRTQLNKYYDMVKRCRICKRLYGLDKDWKHNSYEKKENGICPKCSERLKREERRKNANRKRAV